MDVESDVIRIPPKPFARPTPSAIFEASSQLNLTPEKQSKRNSRRKSKNKHEEGYKLKPERETRAKELDVLVTVYDKLGHPSLNSTALIANTLTAAQQQKFDASLAVKEELMKSETARIKISEKVSQTVNVKKTKKVYSQLVPVDVNQEEIISSHTVARIPRLPKKTSDIAEPDIMTFFPEHFEEETADFDFDVLNDEEPLPKPMPVAMAHTFDFYHHMECWEPQNRQTLPRKPDD